MTSIDNRKLIIRETSNVHEEIAKSREKEGYESSKNWNEGVTCGLRVALEILDGKRNGDAVNIAMGRLQLNEKTDQSGIIDPSSDQTIS